MKDGEKSPCLRCCSVLQEQKGHGRDALLVSPLRHQQADLDRAAAHEHRPPRPRGGRRRSVLACTITVSQAGL